jgi:hypothetical protein
VRAIVCGGRNFHDWVAIENFLSKLELTEIIEGGAHGADYHAAQYARKHEDIKLTTVKANWNAYGKTAGPIRNQEMLDMKPDVIIAFPGGRGTADMVRRGKAAGIEVIEVRVKPCPT